MPTQARLVRQLQQLTTPWISDDDLVARFVQSRDEAAFADLVDRYAGMVYRCCRRTLADHGATEDAMQATFLVLARKASQLRPGALAGWLHGVSHRIALRARARLRKKKTTLALPEELPDRQGDLLDELSARELLALLDEEVQRLSEVHRQVVILCVLEGLSVSQAAQRLGWSIGSVKGRLERGRKLLREGLRGRGVDASAPLAMVGMMREVMVPSSLAKLSALSATGPAASEGALKLASEVLQSRFVSGMRWMAVCMVGLFACGAGLMMTPTATRPKTENAAPPAEAKATPRVDGHGDPLPPGAMARIGTVRLQHGGGGACVAFSPDGKFLATAGRDGSVRIWDPRTGKEQQRFLNPATLLYHKIQFSSDGKRLLAFSDHPQSIRIWDLTTGKHIFTSEEPLNGNLLAFAPDGKSAILGTLLPTVPGAKLEYGIGRWQPNKRLEVMPLTRHKTPIIGIALAPDGKLASSFSVDGTVLITDMTTSKVIHRLVGSMGFPTEQYKYPFQMAFSKDGKRLALGSIDTSIRIWEMDTGKTLPALLGHTSEVGYLHFLNHDTLLTIGCDSTLRTWDLRKHEVRSCRQFPIPGPWCGALSPDGKTLALSMYGGWFQMWNLEHDHPSGFTIDHRYRLFPMSLNPAGTYIAGGQANDLVLWDAATAQRKSRITGHTKPILQVVWSPRGDSLFTAGEDGAIRNSRVDGKEIRTFLGHEKPVHRMCLSSDGQALYSAGYDDTIRRWDVRTGKEIWRIARPGSTFALAISPDGRFLASDQWSGDGRLELSDATTGRLLRHLAGHRGQTYGLSFSPDGRLLASCGNSQGIVLTDVASGGQLAHLTRVIPSEKNSGAYHLSFSPDSKTLYSGEGDHLIAIWEVLTRKQRGEITGHQGAVEQLALSRDGKRLVSSSADFTALTWSLVPPPRSLPVSEVGNLWEQLGHDDARKAHEAMMALRASPATALPYLSKQVKPVPHPDLRKLSRWIEELDSDAFATRQNATRQLEEVGQAAEGELRKALEHKPGLETTLRIGKLLDKLTPLRNEESLRQWRVIEMLESMDHPIALAILRDLARGAPGAWQTIEAAAALKRLERR